MTQDGFGHNPFDQPMGDPTGRGPAGAPPPVVVHPVSTETNTLATLSVVFAFVFAPVGAILGHLGLGQIKRTGQRGRERALIGITLSYVVILAAVIGLVVWAAGGNDGPAEVAGSSTPASAPAPATMTTAAPPPAPTVSAAALPEILVPLMDLRTLIGDQGQTPVATTDKVEMPPNDAGTFSDYSCFASFVAGTPNAYDGTDWRHFYGADSVNNQTGFQIGQAAVLFDDNRAAQRALDGYLAKWRECAGKTVDWTLPNGVVTVVTFGAPEDMGNGIWMLNNTLSQMTVPVTFARILAVKENVLVDNGVTGPDVGDSPMNVTRAMLDRIKP